MARIDVLPSIGIILGLKGILDFYLWRGLPCVRAWPQYRPTRQSAASKASALLFGAVIKAFILTHEPVLEQLSIEATGIPRTPRDLYVSGVYGNLHEASMSDFLDLLTECRDFLSNLTALLNALDSIDTDELVVNVDQSVLPAGASTAAAQATQLTALQKIDDLQDALESKALDRLLVRGMDQVFTYKGTLLSPRQGNVSGANGYYDSFSPAAGLLWKVTNVKSLDITSPTTLHRHFIRYNDNLCHVGQHTSAFAAGDNGFYHGEFWLEPGQVVRTYFAGAQAGDIILINLSG